MAARHLAFDVGRARHGIVVARTHRWLLAIAAAGTDGRRPLRISRLAAAPGRLSLGIFRGTMILLVLAGTWGIRMHYHGNAEFELEMYPSLESFDLFWKAIKGATPVLAPGAVIGLGLLGWVYSLLPGNSANK